MNYSYDEQVIIENIWSVIMSRLEVLMNILH